MNKPFAVLVLVLLALIGFGVGVGLLQSVRILFQVGAPLTPVAQLRDGPARVRGKVEVARPLTAPLGGGSVAHYHTQVNIDPLQHQAKAGTREVGFKEETSEFSVADDTGSVRVHLKEALAANAAALESQRANGELIELRGSEFKEEGKRVLRAVLAEPDVNLVLNHPYRAVIRETAIAAGQDVTVQGFFRNGSGLHGAADHPMLIADGDGAGATGSIGGKLLVQALVLVGCLVGIGYLGKMVIGGGAPPKAASEVPGPTGGTPESPETDDPELRRLLGK